MLNKACILALLSAVTANPLARRAQVPGFDYQNDKIRGVNIGGWLVLEPYITPSLFSEGWDTSNIPVDEYHFTQFLGKEKAQQVLEHHWDTWIQECDFQNMASWGLNFARLPVGYWAFLARPEDPYVQGQLQYLDRAIGWARQYGIKVWIDMHGVPGSQNGFDNSGLRDTYQWLNSSTSNLQDTYTALQTLIDRYGGSDYTDVVIGIEPVNEPLPPFSPVDGIHDYYDKSYGMIRDKDANQGAIFHDMFQPLGTMDSWLNNPDYYNAIIDHHVYQWTTTDMLEMSIDQHISQACDQGTQMKQQDNKWHVVGEWSAALTDCTPLLNGVYRGARYDATYENTNYIGSCAGITDISQWSDEHKQNTRKFVEAQLDSYEYGGSGWVLWCLKTENSIEWDMNRLIEYGLFPNPVTDRQYQNQCGFGN